jgi:dTMP kinase
MLVAVGEDVHVTAEPSNGPIGQLCHALVMQRFDGVDPAFLWQLNAEAERPDLAVILEADPAVITKRLNERGAHNRFQLTPAAATPKCTSTGRQPSA